MALHYLGSEGGGPDDTLGVHKYRRSKINGFAYRGYAYDPIKRIDLNQTLSWSSAEPVWPQDSDRCSTDRNPDPVFVSAGSSAMFVREGYGKIYFSYPILRTILKERFHDVTVNNTLQSIHFGGEDTTNVTSYHYVYPRVKFHTSIRVIALNSEGSVDSVPLSLTMTPQFERGAKSIYDYLCQKVFYDTGDRGLAHIVVGDMYEETNQKNATGVLNLKASLTSTWFPDYARTFFASGNLSDYLDIPLNFGFGALSPYDITIVAANRSNTFHIPAFQFYSNHLFVVNLDQDNTLNVTRDSINRNLAYVHPDPNFGSIEDLVVDGSKHIYCREGCTVTLGDGTTSLEAYNMWGGKATYSLDPLQGPDYSANQDLILYVMAGLVILFFVVQSKRLLRWLGFSS